MTLSLLIVNPPRNGEVAARRGDGGAEGSPACTVLALRRFDPSAPAGHLPVPGRIGT